MDIRGFFLPDSNDIHSSAFMVYHWVKLRQSLSSCPRYEWPQALCCMSSPISIPACPVYLHCPLKAWKCKKLPRVWEKKQKKFFWQHCQLSVTGIFMTFASKSWIVVIWLYVKSKNTLFLWLFIKVLEEKLRFLTILIHVVNGSVSASNKSTFGGH